MLATDGPGTIRPGASSKIQRIWARFPPTNSRHLPHAAIRDDLRTLADLGYEGEADTIAVAFKKPKNATLTDQQSTFNRAHNRLRAVGERGNSLLKTTFKALRNVSLNPWRISDIAAAALVVLHLDHARTT